MNQNLTRNILNDLCVTLGICLHESEIQQILKIDIESNIDFFIKKVFEAEGLDYQIEMSLFKKSRQVVFRHLPQNITFQ